MIDCSPGAGVAAPEVRIKHAEKKRDTLSNNIKTVKQNIEETNTEISIIQQTIQINKEKKKNLEIDVSNYSETLAELKKKNNRFLLELNQASDLIMRYQIMAQTAGPPPNVMNLQKDIDEVRSEIVEMEKQIIECRNQAILSQQINQAQYVRSQLIKNDAKLLDKLYALTVELQILQFSGNQKLITDAEYIIEKQLASEELRNELECTLNNQETIDKDIILNEEMSLDISKVTSQAETENFIGNDTISVDIERIATDVSKIRDRLNLYLKRDRKIIELEKSKRRKELGLQKIEHIIEKYQKNHDLWVSKRNEMMQTEEFFQTQMDTMNQGRHLNLSDLNEFLKKKKRQYSIITQKRNEIASQINHLNVETADFQSEKWKARVEQAKAEIETLEITKNDILKRQKTFKTLNTQDGIREIQKLERSINQIESEVNSMIMNSTKIRRKKKLLKQEIAKYLQTLNTLGINPPLYSFQAQQSFDP